MLRFCKLEGHAREVNSCAFSSNYFVTCSGDKSIRIYANETFKELSYSPVKSFKYGINHVTFNSNGSILAAAGTDGKAHLFSLNNHEAKIIVIFRHSDTNTVQTCMFSNDSQMLVTGSADGSIALWDIGKKRLIKEIAGHSEGMVHAIAFTPCNFFLVTGSTLGDIRVWNMWKNQMKPLLLKQAHEDGVSSCGVSCIVFSPTFHTSVEEPDRYYLMASCGHDNMLKLWIFEVAARQLRLFQTLAGHKGPVSGCCFSSDGKRLASSSFDKTIIVWDPILCEQVYVLEGHAAFCTFVCYSRDDTYLASTSYDKTCIIWNIPKDQAKFPQLGYETSQEGTNLIQLNRNPTQGNQSQPSLSSKSISTTATGQSPGGVPVKQWSCEKVGKWLKEELGLGQYVEQFVQNEIDGAELASLTSETLQKDLGVGPLGHRNKILRAIKALSDSGDVTQDKGGVDLGSLVNSLPPAIQQMAPAVIKQFIRSQNAEPAGTSSGIRKPLEWQNVPPAQTQPTVRDVRQAKLEAEKGIPDEYLCPITREIMVDPVIAADGFSYERESISAWIKKGNPVSPMTNEALQNRNLVPNQTLKTIIGQFLESRKPQEWVELGVE